MNKRGTNSEQRNLIVTGNGFDLACGEKTSIYDFVKSIVNHPANSFSDYKLNFIVWILKKLIFNDYYKDDLIKFLRINESELSDWMDFEKIISHLVLDEIVFNKLEEIYEKPYNYVNLIRDSVSNQIAQYFQNFLSWHKNIYNSEDSFVEFLEKAVKEFERQLLHYLSQIDSDKKIYAHKELLLEKLRYGYEKTSVMDFNYTSLPYDPVIHPVYYIHGNTGVGCLVGIDPYFQNPGSTDLYKKLGQKIRFTKVYKRLKYYSEEELRQAVLTKNINRITFFGHSLGEQDYSYFQSIFDFIDLYSSDVIMVFCYMEYDTNGSVKEIERTTNRVFKLINRYGETLSNKDHGNNLLNKLLLEGRLVFREIVPEEIFTKEKLEKLYTQYEID